MLSKLNTTYPKRQLILKANQKLVDEDEVSAKFWSCVNKFNSTKLLSIHRKVAQW
jgi:heterodisulfide reductase subunit C